jgi:UDP-N-acetylglucosamine transferase subunit ALG13
MIFVSTGTHELPFDRLVEAAGSLCDLEEVVVQSGTSTCRPAGCVVHAWMSPEDMWRHMVDARVIVTHAGPATLFEAHRAGKIPIVVPRDPAHGEHVDGHQLRFADHLRGRLPVCADPRFLPDVIMRLEHEHCEYVGLDVSSDRNLDFCRDVDRICARAVRGAAPQRSLRDTLRSISAWIRSTS